MRRWTKFFLLNRPDRFKLELTHGQAKNLVADTQTKRGVCKRKSEKERERERRESERPTKEKKKHSVTFCYAPARR